MFATLPREIADMIESKWGKYKRVLHYMRSCKEGPVIYHFDEIPDAGGFTYEVQAN